MGVVHRAGASTGVNREGAVWGEVFFPGHGPDPLVEVLLVLYRKLGQGKEDAAGHAGPQARPVGHRQAALERDTRRRHLDPVRAERGEFPLEEIVDALGAGSEELKF